MADTIKNYSDLNDTPETFEDVNKNQVIVKGLRQKVEQSTSNYALLLDKYRSVQANFKKEDEGELKASIDRLKETNNKKAEQIVLLQTSMNNQESLVANLKEKLKETQDQLAKLNNNYLPKLKDVQVVQKSLLEEFAKLKKDIDGVSVTLDAQNEAKDKLQNQIKQKSETIKDLANILGRERRRIKELK